METAAGPPLPRGLAVLLAVGGSAWGVLLLLMFGPLAVLPFGLGYLVTAGYVVRSVMCPRLDVRRVIWIASIAVQGGSFASNVLSPTGSHAPMLLLWWGLATACSIIAVVNEKPDVAVGDNSSCTT